MHTIDLKNTNLRTDLVIDEISNNEAKELGAYPRVVIETKNTKLEEIEVTEELEERLHKKVGYYSTVTFQDVTDKNNFKDVEDVMIQALKFMYEKIQLKDEGKVLVVGLGNENSTPDSLGPKAIDQVLVTRHLFLLGDVEEGYRSTASFKPSVTGATGIETKDLIEAVKDKVNPDLIIVIDALATNSIERLNKTIQVSTSGISPGSGIGNDRAEISEKTLGIPVLAIGIPTVVDATTIVQNTLQLLLKQISYRLSNQDNDKLKLVPANKQDYHEHQGELTDSQKEDVLGMVGLLSDTEQKELLLEVLLPVNYNLMVTPKEIDYIMDKLSLLLGNAINKSLHTHFNPTN